VDDRNGDNSKEDFSGEVGKNRIGSLATVDEVLKMNAEDSREEVLKNVTEKALQVLLQSGNCAQTTFLVLKEQFDLDGGRILKALTPFPGIALRGETCGAVIGSLMALGLVFGRDSIDDMPGYLRSLPPARKFCRRFEKEQGGTMCGAILEKKLGRRYNLANPMESAAYFSSDGPRKCAEVVACAVRIAAEIILSRG
jgi:C_GCAxxG_C_C family probable redox protein